MNQQPYSPPPAKSIWNPKLIIVVCAISFFTFAIIVMSVIMITTGGKEDDNVETQQPDTTTQIDVPLSSEPKIAITACPEQVTSDSPSFNLEGYIVSDTGSCSLKINGESVTTTGLAGNQVKWSKYVQLSSGETRELVFEATDDNGNTTSETRYVYCQPLQTIEKKPVQTIPQSAPVTPGCLLVKKKPGGLNIREYPGIYYDVVDYINDNDYTSTMTFTGYYEVSYDTYTWYEVISPGGKHGYVRSDLVRAIK